MEKVSALGWGLGKALGQQLSLGVVYDRDYHCAKELAEITSDLKRTVILAHFHRQKEMENYLLQPQVLDRALRAAISDRAQRMGEKPPDIEGVSTELLKMTEKSKAECKANTWDAE